MKKTIYALSAIMFSLMLSACGGGGGGSSSNPNTWTWVSGSNLGNQTGTYGTKNTPSTANVPGGRSYLTGSVDTSDNLWLFGGWGFDSAGTGDYLNDLWRWDGSRWTWISGSNIVNQSGTYGSLNTPNASNVPGARQGAVSWIGVSGNFWLFGGSGYDSAGTVGHLNDLWRWDGSNWTWMSGSNVVSQSGTYGVVNTPNASNVPGARSYSTGWIDASGDLWLFGGSGYDSAGTAGLLNGLWRWDGSDWTWMSGSNVVSQSGTYGVVNTPNASNDPGARLGSVSWIDASGNLLLFGGSGFDSAGNSGRLNDLWRWDGSNWTWMSGSDTRNQSGTYGMLGTANASNVPGGRMDAAGWVSNNTFWLFGGGGYDSAGASGGLNDLWRWDGTNWTWMKGSDTRNQAGNFGMLNTPAASNTPGAKEFPASWADSLGNLWLFGGYNGMLGETNDLWKYEP